MSDAVRSRGPVLEAHAIEVRFGGLQALRAATVEVERGTITGLIGPNGAGKTTLFDVITGFQPPYAGRVLLEGSDVTRLGPSARARRGLARTFQKLEAFNSLSARDNILVAAERGHRRVAAERVADSVIDRIGLGDVAEITVGTLPTGTARLVELARALACEPTVLLLDEASSGLSEEETAAVGELLARLVAESDLGILLVEHDMAFVMNICTWIHVLDFGDIIAVGTPDEVRADPAVRAAYLGTEGET